jgi:hypothetical protein
MYGVLLGRDYTTVGQDGEFAARDWVKSALPTPLRTKKVQVMDESSLKKTGLRRTLSPSIRVGR